MQASCTNAAQDCSRAGLLFLLESAYPGAIVLMHDGGGDRSQTVAALQTILETLSSQGYVFEVVCR